MFLKFKFMVMFRNISFSTIIFFTVLIFVMDMAWFDERLTASLLIILLLNLALLVLIISIYRYAAVNDQGVVLENLLVTVHFGIWVITYTVGLFIWVCLFVDTGICICIFIGIVIDKVMISIIASWL
jgi:hypothetical protein